jgi:hypothetical protein
VQPGRSRDAGAERRGQDPQGARPASETTPLERDRCRGLQGLRLADGADPVAVVREGGGGGGQNTPDVVPPLAEVADDKGGGGVFLLLTDWARDRELNRGAGGQEGGRRQDLEKGNGVLFKGERKNE